MKGQPHRMFGVCVRGDRRVLWVDTNQVCLEGGLGIWKPEPRKTLPLVLWRGRAWMPANLDLQAVKGDSLSSVSIPVRGGLFQRFEATCPLWVLLTSISWTLDYQTPGLRLEVSREAGSVHVGLSLCSELIALEAI